MATSPIHGERPGAQGFRRSFTLPARSLSLHEQAALNKTDAKAEILYSHPTARIFSFTPPTESIRSSSKAPIPDDTDYPVDTIETLPWRSRTETLAAAGHMLIEKVRGSTNFLKCQEIMHAILRNSQCWCVDGESKFVLRVRKFQYYRIELPSSTEDDKKKVEELKQMLPTVLRYERTPCPFIRAFQVDLPDDAITPRRKGQWKRRDSSQPGTPEQESPTGGLPLSGRSWNTRAPPSAYPRNGPSYNISGSAERPGSSTGFVRRHSLLSGQDRLENPEGIARQSSYGSEKHDSENDSNEDVDTDMSDDGNTDQDSRGRQTNITPKEARSLSVSARVAAFETVRAESQTRSIPARELSRTRFFKIRSPSIEQETPITNLHGAENVRDGQDSVAATPSPSITSSAKDVSHADSELPHEKGQLEAEMPSSSSVSAVIIPQVQHSQDSSPSSADISHDLPDLRNFNTQEESLPITDPSNSQHNMEHVLNSGGIASTEPEPLPHSDGIQPISASGDLVEIDLQSYGSNAVLDADRPIEKSNIPTFPLSPEAQMESTPEPYPEQVPVAEPEIDSEPVKESELAEELETETEPEVQSKTIVDTSEADIDDNLLSTPKRNSILSGTPLSFDHHGKDHDYPLEHADTISTQLDRLDAEQDKLVPFPDEKHDADPNLESDTDHMSGMQRDVPAKEDLDDNLSTISSADSFHTLTSDAIQSQSDSSSKIMGHPSAEENELLSNSISQHRRDLSDMTVTALSFDETNVVNSETPLARSVQDWQATEEESQTAPQPVMSELRQRRHRSSSPLPPESTLFTGSNTSPWQDTSHHMTKAILQKAIIKPIEVMVLVIHILSRIASGATVNDLLSGELFRRPEHRRRVSGFADQSTSATHDEDAEDDYGIPIRQGRSRARQISDGTTERSKEESLGTGSSTSID